MQPTVSEPEPHDALALPDERRFTCLPGCGLCCSYRVILTDADLQRLAPVAGEDALTKDMPPALARTPDFCTFLDANQRCTIYDHRPQQCRAYPYLQTRYHHAELDVDLSCPGLGVGAVCGSASRPSPSPDAASLQAAIQQTETLLRAQQLYAAPDVLRRLGKATLAALAELWEDTPTKGVGTLAIQQDRPITANAEADSDLAWLQQGLALHPLALTELITPDFIARHFGRLHRNTRRNSSATTVTRYSFFATSKTLVIQDSATTHVDLDQLATIPWPAEALATRHAYLARWLRRQLPVRLANNVAVARLGQRTHVAHCYLEFLLDIDQRLAVLAPALALGYRKTAIDRDIALEAIRGSDNVLRAWCESAQISLGG